VISKISNYLDIIIQKKEEVGGQSWNNSNADP
jgi:hypothetical protein